MGLVEVADTSDVSVRTRHGTGPCRFEGQKRPGLAAASSIAWRGAGPVRKGDPPKRRGRERYQKEKIRVPQWRVPVLKIHELNTSIVQK